MANTTLMTAGAVRTSYVDNGDETYALEVATTGGYPPLYAYVFRAASSDATLTGYFVDSAGRQISALLTKAITSGADVTFKGVNGDVVPPTGAVGFVGKLATASIVVGLGGISSYGAASYSPGAGYPIIAAADYVSFGRVA